MNSMPPPWQKSLLWRVVGLADNRRVKVLADKVVVLALCVVLLFAAADTTGGITVAAPAPGRRRRRRSRAACWLSPARP
ncbi:hypothetical protein [Actinomyces trachealis]|uniref:hypothetical protein n=1 Tax=Actinomyces trachealis TaxID=2763540 RepID=UPI001892B6D3|nr:hypothetical protein [Actinomyces trachealis]